MILERWFCQPVWHEFYEFDYKRVANQCLEIEKTLPSRSLSNMGGYQSPLINLKDYPEFAEMNKVIERGIASVTKYIRTVEIPTFETTMESAWVNVSRKGNYNSVHSHPGSTLSGCIYIVADEDAGALLFRRSDASIHYPIHSDGNHLRMFSMTAKYAPSPGLLVIFPSWLEHEVQACNSDLRISIAFNLTQKRGGDEQR